MPDVQVSIERWVCDVSVRRVGVVVVVVIG